ncbi:MAG TPA: ABC transporter ATP-binding protein [Bacteroidota bacterium]|nr:ABC transporter ATP-binding protein [Bacteroidota bacterium]
MSSLRLRNISKTFGAFRALAPIDLEVHEGEFFSLLGPSGCGKTTLLRIIAGLESPSSGSVIVDDADITQTPPQKRSVGIVFQNYALFPHMTVFENVAYGLEAKKLPREEIRSKVRDVLSKVHLLEKADIIVPQLSGGEQQRVAVARAVVVSPGILLFDEPLSNLDYALRLETRKEIKRLQREVGITTVYVTHDQGEALALSDRIAVLNKGIVQQIGAPEELYFHPRNVFTAAFIGHANLFSASNCAKYFGVRGIPSNEFLAVLPEEITLSARSGKATGTITEKQFSGSVVEYTVDFGGQSVRASGSTSAKSFSFKVGERVSISFPRTLRRKVKDA